MTYFGLNFSSIILALMIASLTVGWMVAEHTTLTFHE
jgi:hypothetical protein